MIRMIVACDRNRLIGSKGRLPWQIEEDWEHFLQTTHGGTLIMGRRCYEDFTEYAKLRTVVVLSRKPEASFEHAESAGSLEEGIRKASKTAKDIWICGGAAIYEEAMSCAEELYLTEIDAEFSGDVYFPDWQSSFTRIIDQRVVWSGSYKLTFSILKKG